MKRKNSIPEEEIYEPEEETEDTGFGTRVAAVFSSTRNRIILISVLVALCLVSLIVGIVLGVRSCSLKNSSPVDDLFRYDIGEYKTNTRVKYSSETLETVERVKPVAETTDERDAFMPEGFTFDEDNRYPTYGSTLKDVIGTTPDKIAARSVLIREAGYLCAWGTAGANNGGAQTPDKYVMMDKDGWLYQFKDGDGERIHSLVYGTDEYKESNYRRLYKHSASDGMYLGNVADDEQAIVKRVTLHNRGYSSYSVTGVYAPAGEVIKIQLSDADMKATGGITIHIGQALYNGQANNIWTSKNQMQRFPLILNTMTINQKTADYDESTGLWTGYVGSFVGGPLYIRNNAATFTATISGGVAYSHFILGYTTQKEFEENAKSSAPYFDLEVWDRGVLHSGPVRYAKAFSYEDLYKAAVLWDKVASVTTTGSNQGIVFVYDPFVAAGAAVAFPGRSSVNCPSDWMTNSLNYNGIVTSGAWGNFHEYHHNFQGYGVGNGGEVTNNGMTLVSYSLFTKISSKRGISSYGAQGLGGWNNYTSATWALEETLKIPRGGDPENGKQGLALYATLLHNFGQDNYINAKVAGGGQSYAAYMNAWQKVTHNNMYYYFNDILKGTGLSDNADAAYPVFVPVSSVYQTGRSYLYHDEATGQREKKYFNTMQPYVIPYGYDFTIDLREYFAESGQYRYGSVVIPDGFKFEVTNITQPQNGTVTATDTPNVYIYKPNAKAMKSGKIYATLKITKDDKSFVVDDVDLVLEFEQSHETKKTTLERTTYTFAAADMYTDAVTAYENNFKGYQSVDEKWDHKNPTQNANTDIWYYPDTEDNRKKYPDAPESFFVHDNTIEVIDGKLYVEEDGKYRVFLRGRVNCALYYSLDGKDYKLGATVKKGSGSGFYLDNPDTYFDIEFSEKNVYVDDKLVKDNFSGERWIYIREVLIVQSSNPVSYIGVGLAQWTVPLYTTSVDDKGNIHYYDANGKEVSADEASDVSPVAPKKATYVNAYRNSYEFPTGGFESDYYYVRNYDYNYTDNLWQNETTEEKKQTVVSTNYITEIPSWNNNQFKTENLVDGNRNTFVHSKDKITESKPLEFVIDMGEVKPVNRMIIYTQNRPNGDWHVPKDFILYGSVDGVDFFKVGEFTDAPRSGVAVTVDFEEKSFRYYKLVITRSDSLCIIGEIEMWRMLEVNGGKQVSPDDDMFTYKGNWSGAQANSTFGHVYVGTKKATVTFEFEGTRLGIFSSAAYGNDFEIKIDGKKISSINLKEGNNGASLVYLSEELSSGKHSVTIKCNDTSDIDSFVFYP